MSRDLAGQRLDRFCKKWLGIPRSLMFKAIRTGMIRVSGEKKKYDYRLRAGDVVTSRSLEKNLDAAERPDIPPRVVRLVDERIRHEDPDFWVIDKPSGIVAHRGTDHAWGLVEICHELLDIDPNAVTKPALVHRLDRDTSGLICLARTQTALKVLNRHLRRGRFEKRYLAFVKGHPPDSGQITDRLHRTEGGRMEAGRGKEAVTRYRVQERFPEGSLVEVDLETGRRHQIRAHFAHRGHPLAHDLGYGDPDYDKPLKSKGLDRLFLHAHRLAFPHPETGDRVEVESPLPDRLAAFLKSL